MRLYGGIEGALKGEESAPSYFFALIPFGWAYSLVMRARAWLYARGALASRRLPCKVISVGNLTAGGTGKTPMTVHIVRRLTALGMKSVVLTRGYGGSREGETLVVSDGNIMELTTSECGDEPALLARLLPGVPVVMGADRYAAGMLAIERFSPDVAVLDDGFQHMALARDLDILLLDARRPFGNGRLIPAGYLREPVTASARADVVVLTRADMADEAELAASAASVSGVCGGSPVLTASHVPAALREIWGTAEHAPGYLAGRPVFGFSGIADPASFALILKRLGAKISGLKAFPDHQSYTAADMEEVAALAVKSGAELVVTTEKDAVKLGRSGGPAGEYLSVGIELELTHGEQYLDNLLREKVNRS